MKLEFSKKPQEKKIPAEIDGRSRVLKLVYRAKKEEGGLTISAVCKIAAKSSETDKIIAAQVKVREASYGEHRYSASVNFEQSEVKPNDLLIWSVLLRQLPILIEQLFNDHGQFFKRIDFMVLPQFFDLEAEDPDLIDEDDYENDETQPSRYGQKFEDDGLELEQKRVVAELLLLSGYKPLLSDNDDTPYHFELRTAQAK